MSQRLREYLEQPIDGAWLYALRIALGTLLAASMERFVAYGWVESLLLKPQFRFKYYGFSWIEPLSAAGLYGLFYVMIALCGMVLVGLCFRVAASLLAVGFCYIQLIDVSTYLNHYYLAALLTILLACSPAGRGFSVDSWLLRRRNQRRPSLGAGVARLWLVVFRVQVAVVYVGAALAKLQADWLLHAQPLSIWLGQSTSLPFLGRLFVMDGAPLFMSWCGFVFDLTIVFWLLYPRTRTFAYLVLLAFHACTRALFDIGMFPLIMSAAALVFFDPSWPRWFGAMLKGRPAPSSGASVIVPGASRMTSKLPVWGLVLASLYCIFQLIFPLRSMIYPGNVLWHEQGMRFSWRVMVRAKGGSTTFFVVDKSTKRRMEVNPARYLTANQLNEMSGQPDLILQLAHQVGRDLSTDTNVVEVYADTRVSLNGRRAVPLIDPNVDLMKVTDGLAPYTWVLPAPSSAPPIIRPVL